MTEPDFEALGRYSVCMDAFDQWNSQRARTLDALRRWAANARVGRRNVLQLDMDGLDTLVRDLHEQQDQLEQLAHVINTLADDLNKPRVRFVAHQVL